jgi:hypothetical protein
MSWGAQNRSKDAKTPSVAGVRSQKPEPDCCPVQPYMPGETGRIFLGIYYVAYIFMDLRSVVLIPLRRRAGGEGQVAEGQGQVWQEQEADHWILPRGRSWGIAFWAFCTGLLCGTLRRLLHIYEGPPRRIGNIAPTSSSDVIPMGSKRFALQGIEYAFLWLSSYFDVY